MAEVTMSQFSRLCQVSRTAISVGVKNGLIELTGGGKVETENPKNADYFLKHSTAMGEPITLRGPKVDRPTKTVDEIAAEELARGNKDWYRGKGKGSKPISPGVRKPPVDDPLDGLADDEREAAALGDMSAVAKVLDNINVKKSMVDIKLKQAQTRRHEVYTAEKKRELIPKSLVLQEFARLDAAIKTAFRDMPRRIAAQLYAVALSDGAIGVERELESHISRAIVDMHDIADGIK